MITEEIIIIIITAGKLKYIFKKFFRYEGSDKKKNQYKKIYDDDNSSDESINDIINSDIKKRKFSAASYTDLNEEFNKGKNLSLDDFSSDSDYKRRKINKSKGDFDDRPKRDNNKNNQYFNNAYKITNRDTNSNRGNHNSRKSDGKVFFQLIDFIKILHIIF